MGNPQRTWIVVADREHGRFFRHAHPGAVLEAAGEDIVMELEGDPAADRPGRAFESVGDVRHAMEPKTGYAQNHLERVARRIGEVISDAFARQEFERLVLVAPPKTLGELRRVIPEHIRAGVIAELPSRLSHASTRELAERLTSLEVLGRVRDRAEPLI